MVARIFKPIAHIVVPIFLQNNLDTFSIASFTIFCCRCSLSTHFVMSITTCIGTEFFLVVHVLCVDYKGTYLDEKEKHENKTNMDV